MEKMKSCPFCDEKAILKKENNEFIVGCDRDKDCYGAAEGIRIAYSSVKLTS